MGITLMIGVGAYLIGAIPFGYLIARVFYGIDIREHGSKNPGATNVWRTLGKWPGSVTLALDTVKGFGPVFAVLKFYPADSILPLITGALCIIGHNWSVFLLGKGGKGVATSAGVFLALTPKPMAISLLVFLIFFLATRHVSVGSMAAAISLFALTFVFPTAALIQGIVLMAAVLILVRHIPNMRRLAAGTEPKVKFK